MAVIFPHKIKKHNYLFRFYPCGGYFEIDILTQPAYGKRYANGDKTHRVPSGRIDNLNSMNGKPVWKICFGDPNIIKTLADAEKWAKVWAKLTTDYILNGTEFPNE